MMEANRYIYAGSEWIESVIAKENRKISDFGRDVADILGFVFQGIYHIQREALHQRVEWEDTGFIEIVIATELSTYDSDLLTRLVIMCHKHAIRLSIDAAAHGYLRLRFHKRTRDGERLFSRHPSMEDAIESIKKTLANSNDPEWGIKKAVE